MTNSIQIIQTLRRKAGMDEDMYRAFLERETGKRSCKDLTETQSVHVIKKLQAIVPFDPAYKAKGKGAKPSSIATGAFAPKLRALWLTAYNLGLVNAYQDTALIAFVQRQTGVSHTRFLIEPILASKAIEGIKAIIIRGFPDLAKVLVKKTDTGNDALLIKKMVVIQQYKLLHKRAGAKGHLSTCDTLLCASRDIVHDTAPNAKKLDLLQAELGVQIRADMQDTA
jgi:hypothetical protein